MAEEQANRTTLDLFIYERRPGRPRTSPLSRSEQLHINKHDQLEHDRMRGPKRVELKPNTEVVETLDELTESRSMSRSGLIGEMLMQQLTTLRNQDTV